MAAPHDRDAPEGDNPEEFLEHTKLELFHDQVFCFTPKGRLIALPAGPPRSISPMRCIPTRQQRGGRQDQRQHAPLISELQNGDEVEIIPEGQAPPAAWESLVVTGKARAAIRRATRAAVRAQYAGLGRQIVARLFERAKSLSASSSRRPSAAGAGSVEDVIAAVGRGEMNSADVVTAMHPDFVVERAPRCRPRRRPTAAGSG